MAKGAKKLTKDAYIPFRVESRKKALYIRMAKRAKVSLSPWICSILDRHIEDTHL